MNVKTLTHSQQQPQARNAHKKKPTIRLTTRVTMLWASLRSLLYRLLVLDEVMCKTHTQQSTSSRKQPETCQSNRQLIDPTLRLLI